MHAHLALSLSSNPKVAQDHLGFFFFFSYRNLLNVRETFFQRSIFNLAFFVAGKKEKKILYPKHFISLLPPSVEFFFLYKVLVLLLGLQM